MRTEQSMAAALAKDPAIKLFGRTISLPDSHFSDDSDFLVRFTAFSFSFLILIIGPFEFAIFSLKNPRFDLGYVANSRKGYLFMTHVLIICLFCSVIFDGFWLICVFVDLSDIMFIWEFIFLCS